MVMFFGLCNAPATFQAMMNDYFQDLLREGGLVIYMDDILIFSNDEETHERKTRRVLQRCKDKDLYLNSQKCYFDQPEIEFLGMIIRHNQVLMDPVKVQGIRDWPAPTSVRAVRSFLGFGNFYRRFIEGFARLSRPPQRPHEEGSSVQLDSRMSGSVRCTQEKVHLRPGPFDGRQGKAFPSRIRRLEVRYRSDPPTKKSRMETGTQSPTSPSRLIRQNGTIKFTTRNF